MNNLQLLTNAQKILAQSIKNSAPRTAWETGFIALGLAHVDWDSATKTVRDFFQFQAADGFLPYVADSRMKDKIVHPPVWGFVAWKLFQIEEDKAKATDFLKEIYPKIIRFHQYLYETRDPNEEGLCYIQHPLEDILKDNPNWKSVKKTADSEAHFKIQDPLFNTILAWSNESLVRIAEELKEDVTEVVQWDTLTVHTFNEKLWNAKQGIYNAWDLVADQAIQIQGITGLLPLAGWLPEISQALQMLDLINSESFAGTFENAAFMCPSLSLTNENTDPMKEHYGAISMDLNWLLYYGLNQYETPEFLEAAEQIKQQSLNILTKNGFREYFNPLQKNLTTAGLGQNENPISAAILLNWLL
ncbi:MAG: hypothetical protein ACI9XO_004587 [Paraglaciecola sp.]|jgi:hypothetical protein